MKALNLITVFLLIVLQAAAQAPSKFNYQGVARDNSGNAMVSTSIDLRISIVSRTEVGPVVYQEEHRAATNSSGIFNIQVGGGQVIEGAIENVAWEDTPHYISIELKTNDQQEFVDMGTAQLFSVPYAIYANRSGSASNSRDIPFSGTYGQTIYFNGVEWLASSALYNDGINIGIGNTSPAFRLDVGGDVNLASGHRIFIGARPVVSTVGVGNTFIGDLSGTSISTGYNNAFIGYKAGEENTSGHSNTFIGFKAGQLNTSGFSNAFIGQQAGGNNVTGRTNVMIGRRAGFASTSGRDNVFIGHLAGASNTIGSSNTYVGIGADGSSELTNAAAIGANALVTQDSSLVLGNSANVGIGTSAPQSRLHVVGDLLYDDGTTDNTGHILYSTDSLGQATWTDPSNISGLGPDQDWLKYGTNDPANDINDHLFTRNRVTIGLPLTGATTQDGLTINTADVALALQGFDPQFPTDLMQSIVSVLYKDSTSGLQAGDRNQIRLGFVANGSPTADRRFFTAIEAYVEDPADATRRAGLKFHTNPSNTGVEVERMRITGFGNVGINTTNPSQRLHVSGNARVEGSYYDSGNSAGSSGQVLSSTGSGTQWMNVPPGPTGPMGPAGSIGPTGPQGNTGIGLVIVNQANHTSVTVDDDDVVQIDSIINITADFAAMNMSGITVSGGHIIGTGSQTVSFGNNSVVKGVQFSNLKIASGTSTVFSGCSFSNVVEAGHNSSFYTCDFEDCTTTSTLQLGTLNNCELDNCTIPRVNALTNCELFDCQLGGETDPNQFFVGTLTSNEFDDTFAYPEANVVGNTFRDSKIKLQPGLDLSISGNHFTGLLAGKSDLVHLNVDGTAYTNINISGNTFSGNGSLPRHIYINNNFTGTYGLVKISNNNFMRGTQVIVTSNSIPLVVTNNVMRGTTLSISTGGSMVVRDNDLF